MSEIANKTETTCSIYNTIFDDYALKLSKVNSFETDALFLQTFEYGECSFERKSDWMRFINKLNEYDTTPLRRLLVGDKKSSDWEGMTLTNLGDDEYQIELDNPIDVYMGHIGGNPILVKVKTLKGKLTWEWLFRRNGHEDLDNYAGICDVWLKEVEFVN